MTAVELLLETSKADTELLIGNDEKGDVFITPRPVEFLLRASDRQAAELVASFIDDNRYGASSVAEVEGEFHILVVIEMPITQHVLCSVSGLMACVSKLFKVEYDGWGSELRTVAC